MDGWIEQLKRPQNSAYNICFMYMTQHDKMIVAPSLYSHPIIVVHTHNDVYLTHK